MPSTSWSHTCGSRTNGSKSGSRRGRLSCRSGTTSSRRSRTRSRTISARPSARWRGSATPSWRITVTGSTKPAAGMPSASWPPCGRLARPALPLGPLEPGRPVRSALEQVDADVRSRGARVVVDDPLPGVVGHGATLAQVFANLLANGIKFVPRERAPEVRIRAEQLDGRVRLWVEDNGIGIAPEHHERIFRVFERLHPVSVYPGTGIGLALVRKGIERMGGSVGVESELGRGSRFWIELPAA